MSTSISEFSSVMRNRMVTRIIDNKQFELSVVGNYLDSDGSSYTAVILVGASPLNEILVVPYLTYLEDYTDAE